MEQQIQFRNVTEGGTYSYLSDKAVATYSYLAV